MNEMSVITSDGEDYLLEAAPVAVQKLSDLHAGVLEVIRERYIARELASGKPAAEVEHEARKKINSIIAKIDRGSMNESLNMVGRLLPTFLAEVERGIPQLISYQLDRILGDKPNAVEAKLFGSPKSNRANVMIEYMRGGMPMHDYIEVERRAGTLWTDGAGVQYAITSVEDEENSELWIGA